MEKKKRKRREEETNAASRCLEWRSSHLGERRITKRRRGRQRRRPRREGNGRTVFASDALAVIPTEEEENSKGGGQSRLFKAHVFIAGAGGLGCPSVLYLAGAGVGKITARRRCGGKEQFAQTDMPQKRRLLFERRNENEQSDIGDSSREKFEPRRVHIERIKKM